MMSDTIARLVDEVRALDRDRSTPGGWPVYDDGDEAQWRRLAVGLADALATAQPGEPLRLWLVDYRKGREGGVALFSDRWDAVAAMERWVMDGEPVEVRAVVDRLARAAGVL